MPFQEGNQEGRNKHVFQSALKRALARSGKSVDGGLNKVADQLVSKANEGEQWAVKEIADRLDGRPAQSLNVGGQDNNPIKSVHKVEIVDLTSDD